MVYLLSCYLRNLKISSFDPALATTLGINSQFMHYALMTLVAVTTVASFESVGSILVIAMIIVPGACAHLLTDRLHTMIIVSAFIAAISAGFGHLGAITIPGIWGFSDTSTAGMMAVVAGFLFFLTLFLAPRHGVISKLLNQVILGLKITRDDILGLLFRLDEVQLKDSMPSIAKLLKDCNGTGYFFYKVAIFSLQYQGKVEFKAKTFRLTDLGRKNGEFTHPVPSSLGILPV